MSDEGHDSYSAGPDVPPEALSQGTMNRNPNFELNKGDEPEAKKTTFGTVEGGRQKFVKPGRFPLKEKRMKDIDGKVITIKGLTRIDH